MSSRVLVPFELLSPSHASQGKLFDVPARRRIDTELRNLRIISVRRRRTRRVSLAVGSDGNLYFGAFRVLRTSETLNYGAKTARRKMTAYRR